MSNNVTLIPKKPIRHTLLTDTDYVVYMPLASKTTHGIVKIGDGLKITTDGIVSVDFTSDWHKTVKEDINTLKSDISDLETDLDELVLDVSDIDDRLTDVENGTKLISVYQTKQDNGLVTVSKTVVGGINEVKNHAQLNANNIQNITTDVQNVKLNYATIKYVDNLYSKLSVGGNNSYVFETRDQFIEWLDGTFVREDSLKPELLNIGDVIFIEEMGVPDYWVKSKSSPMTINDFREYEAKIDIPEVTIDDVSITKNDVGQFQSIALKNRFVRVGTNVSYSDFIGLTELSNEQYEELITYGSIIVDEETITYNDGFIYVTPDTTETRLEQLETTVTDLVPDVMRALKTPMSKPTELKLVGVNTTNDQEMISLGTGLKFENGMLNVEGTVKYTHNIFIQWDITSSSGQMSLQVTNTTATPYTTMEEISAATYEVIKGTSSSAFSPASGYIKQANGNWMLIFGTHGSDVGSNLQYWCIQLGLDDYSDMTHVEGLIAFDTVSSETYTIYDVVT